MPYSGELADKSSHIDIVKNPDVAAFLEDCDYLTPPSDEEGEAIGREFQPVPPIDGVVLPSNILAFDGSRYEAALYDHLPHTRVGYVKVGTVLIRTSEYDTLRDGKFVDPFKVAKLQDNSDAITITVPSANIKWGNHDTVRDGFRAAVDEYFYGERTRFRASDPSTSLRTTLFHVYAHRPDNPDPSKTSSLKIFRCPSCRKGPIEVADIEDPQFCPYCSKQVYPSDVLRLWEEVNEYQSNVSAITRLMLAVEHLSVAHYLRHVSKNAPNTLEDLAVFVDGPLMVTGPAAWMHRALMRLIYRINAKQETLNRKKVLVLGLQKTGQIADYTQLIDRYIPKNAIFCIDDEHRYTHIIAGREPAANGFGADTHYGQDFIYKTESGRTFVFSLPFPVETKESRSGFSFVEEKTKMENYPELERALALIQHFETDLYENAVVPIALANRYTAISLSPGGRVLDILTRSSLDV